MSARPDKEEYIEKLFAGIAPHYDLLNDVMSCNIHRSWRNRAVRECCLSDGDRALDVCAGTMDLAIGLSKVVGERGSVVGLDFCPPMLEIGHRKIEKHGIRNIQVVEGNAEDLPFQPNSFDCATIGFALRNVADVERTLGEMTRVVKQGGRVVALELARPQNPGVRKVYEFVSGRALPLLGRMIGGEAEPYEYLPASILRFCSREELAGIMEKVGLMQIRVINLTGGIATIHTGTKR